MENIAVILIGITLFVLVIVLGLLITLIYKLFDQNNTLGTTSGPQSQQSENHKSNLHPELLERMKSLEKIRHKRADLFCPNHMDEPGEVTCAICDTLFCKTCVRPFKTLHFCKEHLPLIMRHDWDEVLTIKTSTSDPEQGVRLFDIKKNLFETQNIPTYIETHYKINVDQDHIETYLVLFSIREKTSELKLKLVEFLST